jgi:hydrogenase nickel incorporation protein HypA/HybF
MHEWALAEAVAATVDRVLREHRGARLLAVTVRIGELQRIEREVFEQGLEACLQDRPYGPELFRYEIEEASFRCNLCGREWPLGSVAGLGQEELEAIHFLPETAHVYLRCPECGSPDFRLHSGRGIGVASIDLAEPA